MDFLQANWGYRGLTKQVDHLFKAEEGIALALDRVDKRCAEVDHGRVVLDTVVVVAEGADDILKESGHVST